MAEFTRGWDVQECWGKRFNTLPHQLVMWISTSNGSDGYKLPQGGVRRVLCAFRLVQYSITAWCGQVNLV